MTSKLSKPLEALHCLGVLADKVISQYSVIMNFHGSKILLVTMVFQRGLTVRREGSDGPFAKLKGGSRNFKFQLAVSCLSESVPLADPSPRAQLIKMARKATAI